MSAEIIDGKSISEQIRKELKAEIEEMADKQIVPGLGVILVGDDPASQSYVKAKEKACMKLGIYSDDNRLPSDIKESELLVLINKMNENPKIHGILVQLPLPEHIDESKIISSIRPDKDIDGFHPYNLGRMIVGKDAFLPCTPHGILELLTRSNVTTQGAHAVIVGRSNIVGKPLANLLMRKAPNGNCTVTVCHTRTPDIGYFTRQADIVVAAAGRPGTITGDMIRENAVIIDVGVNRVEDKSKEKGYRLVGDVNFEDVKHKASKITPVPGGVGPMTITMLLHNTVKSAKLLK